MNTSRRHHLLALTAALGAMGLPAVSMAANGFPTRPVTIQIGRAHV